jgi:hypothetical protein
VWREDNSLALACLDKPQILQVVPTAISQGALDSTSSGSRCSVDSWNYVWAIDATGTAAAADSTQCDLSERGRFTSTSTINCY